jgi:hypothetical protein
LHLSVKSSIFTIMKKIASIFVLFSICIITNINAQNIATNNTVVKTVANQIKMLSNKLNGTPDNIIRLKSIIQNFEMARLQEIKNCDNTPATITKINTAYLSQKIKAVQTTLPATYLKNLTTLDLETIFK